MRMCRARVSLIRAMMDASVVDFPDPVGPVSSTRPRGSRAIHSAIGGRPSSSKLGMSEGIIRRARANSPSLVEGAATQSRLVLPREREVDVLVLFQDGLLVGAQHVVDEFRDLGAREHRCALERPQSSVDPDPRLGTTDQEQV